MKNDMAMGGKQLHGNHDGLGTSPAVLVTNMPRRGFVNILLLATAVITGGGALPEAMAKPAPFALDVVPTITNISVVNGHLVAAGTATATLKGKTFTTPFSGVPVDISLAADQTGAGACPISADERAAFRSAGRPHHSAQRGAG
jgi:hypothetical protein